jgi:O-acetyl-ADP-ribose deacetylase (regulator of RNase III)
MKYRRLGLVCGDITSVEVPTDGKTVIIPHIGNNVGVMNAGVAKAIVNKWPQVLNDYKWQYKKSGGLILGTNIRTWIYDQKDLALVIITMIAQDSVRSETNKMPLKYISLIKCMCGVLEDYNRWKGSGSESSICCPKFGSGLAGGNWEFIETLIEEIWIDNGIDVTVYEYY